MRAPHKFLFDTSFDVAEPALATGRRAPPPPPAEPTFSQAELTAARATGFAEGHAAGLVEAGQTIEAQAATALTRFSQGIDEVLAARRSAAASAQARAAEAVRIIVSKLVPALSRRAPLAEVEAMVADCLREAYDEPRVVLRVADSLFEAMQGRLAALTTATGFAGKVVLLADETLGPADARIEWSEGGAERDLSRLIHDIDEALARALDLIPDPGTSRPEENDHERSA